MKGRNKWILMAVVFIAFSLTMAVPGAYSQGITIKMGSYDPVFELDMKSTNGQFGSTNIKCQVFKRIVEELTNGKIKVSIFPNAQLGGDREAFEMVKAGSLQMSGYPGGVLSGFVPEIMAVSIPYMFKDLNIAWRVLESKTGSELADVVLKRTGVRILAWGVDGPYSNIMTLDKEIRVPNDLKGVKIRLPRDPLRVQALKLAGGSPTPISWTEVYTC